MKYSFLTVALFLSFAVKGQLKDYPIQPVVFTQVHVSDEFWKPRMVINAEKTIPYIEARLKSEGRIDNFLAAAGVRPNQVCSEFPFDDTDVYKWIEGASYSLQQEKNPRLEKYIDSVISIIGAAQESDGYLFTFRTIQPNQLHPWLSEKRWLKDEDLSHELYNAGHLYEAAYAHYNATGKRSLLEIALQNADLLCKTFGWDGLKIYPGHQIVEIGLVKLYRITGEKKYLDLARFFLDVRGPNGEKYNQAHQRVVDQTEAVGHAVRAAYMYSGMADVAAITGDREYLKAIDAIWRDVTQKKLYITGGIGATNNGEAFGEAYDLPNMSAYAETCAAIANVYWNNRMFLLHGDSKYIDVLERTLYNGLLSGISLDGTHFFYPNPLASMGQHKRSEWFSCACCISNMTRFLPSVPGYVYAQKDDNLYVNLFMTGDADISLKSGKVNIKQKTGYPWKGDMNLEVNPAKTVAFTLRIRIPGWSQGQPVPGDLYQSDVKSKKIDIKVNGKKIDYVIEKGYATITRTWKKADKVELNFPMEIQKIFSNANVKADQGRFAFQYGPIVYCLEGVDNYENTVKNILVDKSAVGQINFKPEMLEGINIITVAGKSSRRKVNSDEIATEERSVTAIPYYAWNNRGTGEMEVWIPYEQQAAFPSPAPTIANTSKVTASIEALSLVALNDQYTPKSSSDQSNLFFHWWPKKNTTEWVIYTFDKPHEVKSSEVYWFDDGPWGGCRIPAKWKVLYEKDGNWYPVRNTSDYKIEKDKYNKIEFEPVVTTALKLEVQLPENYATGIHEWVVY